MTLYELLTLIISIAAIIISIFALIQNHIISRKQYELDLKQSKLADKQLEIIKNDEEKRQEADIRFSVIKSSQGNKLKIQNVGFGSAYDVNLEIIPPKGKASPIIPSDYADKFPLKKMNPGDSIELFWSIDRTTGTTFDSVCKWKSQNGKEEVKETFLS